MPITILDSNALPTISVTPGVYGNATIIPSITVDSKGRVANISNVAVIIPPAVPDFLLLSQGII
jgi:hypothetical protein